MRASEKDKKKKQLKYKIYFLWFTALLLAVYFSFFVLKNASSQSHGFATYYTASKLLSEGEDVSQFYDNIWFSTEVKKHAPKVYEIYHANFPTTSFLVLPLSAFNYGTAKIIWTIFNLLILLFTIGFLTKKNNFPRFRLPLVLILIFSFQPLYANFLYGQAYVLVFCLLVLAWNAYKSDRDLLLGFAIGLIFVIKSTSFIFFLFLLIQKKWKSLIYAVSAVLFVILATLPWIGIEGWKAYTEKLLSYISHPSLSVTAYQTLHSFFHHLTTFDQLWNREPIVNLPLLGKIFSTISIILVLIFSAVKAIKLKKSDLAFGLFITAGLIISPVSLDYHYTMILLSVFILFKWFLLDSNSIVLTLLAVTVILVAAYIPYTSAKVSGGWLSLFAYPKLYGAVGLWAVFISASGKNSTANVLEEV